MDLEEKTAVERKSEAPWDKLKNTSKIETVSREFEGIAKKKFVEHREEQWTTYGRHIINRKRVEFAKDWSSDGCRFETKD